MVPQFTRTVHSKSTPPPTVNRLTAKQRKRATSSDSEQNSSIRGIPYLRRQWEEKGISERASDIMVKSRRESTTNTYSSPWKYWVLWCQQRQVDPIRSTLEDILHFLTDLYHKGLEYRTINVYRSTLSAYHSPIDGVPVGQIPEVCTLLAGIDQLRPPTRLKYTVISRFK